MYYLKLKVFNSLDMIKAFEEKLEDTFKYAKNMQTK